MIVKLLVFCLSAIGATLGFMLLSHLYVVVTTGENLSAYLGEPTTLSELMERAVGYHIFGSNMRKLLSTVFVLFIALGSVSDLR